MPMKNSVGFTICTPLHDDEERIEALYASLAVQTIRDFEWIIVDDGSEDRGAARAEQLAEDAPFPIQILRSKRRRGAHASVNRAVKKAVGTFFVLLRSEEEILPNCLERLLQNWEAIPASEQPYFSSVTGLSTRPDGTVRGDKFPSETFDSTHFEVGGRYGISGRKWGFHRTEVLEEYPFPEKKGELYCPEGLVLNRIGQRYLTRYVNEAFAICSEDDAAADRAVPPIEQTIRGPEASALFFKEQLSLPIPLSRKIRAAVSYVRLALHAGRVPDDIYAQAPKKLFVFFVLPFGYLLYRRDRSRGLDR